MVHLVRVLAAEEAPPGVTASAGSVKKTKQTEPVPRQPAGRRENGH